MREDEKVFRPLILPRLYRLGCWQARVRFIFTHTNCVSWTVPENGTAPQRLTLAAILGIDGALFPFRSARLSSILYPNIPVPFILCFVLLCSFPPLPGYCRSPSMALRTNPRKLIWDLCLWGCVASRRFACWL